VAASFRATHHFWLPVVYAKRIEVLQLRWQTLYKVLPVT
jgi:hypothetical protein